MVSIRSVQLEIVENQGAAAARVTYKLFADPQDVQQRRTYIEAVELIGVDEGDGEDGKNEPIPNSRVEDLVTFPIATPDRMRLIALPSSALNEDQGVLHDIQQDEIRAQVTLAQSRNSNLVKIGGVLPPKGTLAPA